MKRCLHVHSYKSKMLLLKIYNNSKLFTSTQLLKLLSTTTVYTVFFEGFMFCGRQVRDFHGLIFAGYEVEYIASLSHCFFSRIKISRLTSLQRNPGNFHLSKITAYTVHHSDVKD